MSKSSVECYTLEDYTETFNVTGTVNQWFYVFTSRNKPTRMYQWKGSWMKQTGR